MTAEQLVVLALIVAAFVAGWVARGSGRGGEEEAEAPGAGAKPATARLPGPSPAPGADPVAGAARALAFAASAFETAVERWLDERDAITPAGRAAVGELERAVQRLDVQSTRLDELDHPLADAAWDALDALRDGARHFHAFRSGAALDAVTSRALDDVEDELEQARAAFERAPT